MDEFSDIKIKVGDVVRIPDDNPIYWGLWRVESLNSDSSEALCCRVDEYGATLDKSRDLMVRTSRMVLVEKSHGRET
jgi:hypothetical protein